MTPAKTLLAEAFFAKGKFAMVRYRIEKDVAEKIDLFFESVVFFVSRGHLGRARTEFNLAKEFIEQYS